MAAARRGGDGARQRHRAFDASSHEVHLTHGALQLGGIGDLLEAFELSLALLEVQSCAPSDELPAVPPRLVTHQMRQAFLAASLSKTWAWRYSQSAADETTVQRVATLQLQHAGLLATRYALSLTKTNENH